MSEPASERVSEGGERSDWSAHGAGRPAHSALEAVGGSSASSRRAASVAFWGTWWFGAGVPVPGLEPHCPGLESELCHLLVVGFNKLLHASEPIFPPP